MPRVRRCRLAGCHNFAYMPNHYCPKHIKYEEQYRKQREQFAHRHYNRRTQWRYNHITRFRNPVKAKQNKFYHSKQWKDLRQVVLRRDYHLCQYCKALGRITEGNIIDHVLPVEQFSDQMRNISNMVTCCQHCHYWKTRWEEQYYGTGLHGKPTGNTPVNDIKLIAKLSKKIELSNGHKWS